MSNTQTLLTDPVRLVRQLDAGVIRARLDALDEERQALLVLLRAAQRIHRDTDAEHVEARQPADRDDALLGVDQVADYLDIARAEAEQVMEGSSAITKTEASDRWTLLQRERKGRNPE